MRKRPLFLLFLILAGWIYGFNGGRVPKTAPLPEKLEEKQLSVTGQVIKQEYKNNNHILYLTNISILEPDSGTYHSNIAVYIIDEQSYQLGNLVQVQGICTIPEPASNPGQFDFLDYYSSQNIGFLLKKATGQIVDKKNFPVRQYLDHVGKKGIERLGKIGNQEETAIMSAILFGDKTELGDETKELFQLGSVAHILAISGLHISLIGMAVYGLLRKAGGGIPWSAVLSGGIMVAYGVMTGMSVSAARAILMFLVFLGAQILGRTYDLLSSVSLAGILILVKNPAALFQSGFQLSFLAVFAIALIRPCLIWLLGKTSSILDGIITSTAVHLFFLPALLSLFYYFPLYSIGLNLLILPLMPMILLSGMAGVIGSVWSIGAGQFLFAPCHYLLELCRRLCLSSISWPGALQIWGEPGLWQIFGCYGILLSMAGVHRIWIYRTRNGKKTRVGAFAAIWGLVVVLELMILAVRPQSPFSLTFLDVGQGDSAFLQRGNKSSWLIDGGSSSVSKVGKYRIIPFLMSRGIGKVDYIFLTHMDEDHINGVREILEDPFEKVKVGHLVLPHVSIPDDTYQEITALAKARGIPVITLSLGQRLREDDLTITCLWPAKEFQTEKTNEYSLVLEINYKAKTFLMTGDVEGAGEKGLMEAGLPSQVDILKVAHHGSANSTPLEFLRQTQPKAAVISCSRNNSYGHPHPDTIARLESIQCGIWCTMAAGAVTLYTDGETIRLEFEFVPGTK